MTHDHPLTAKLTDEQRWTIALAKDRRYDGQFVTGVHSTGIYCRPSCPARSPKRENVRFYASPAEAEAAGLRACKRCLPNAVARDEAAVRAAIDEIKASDGMPKLDELAALTGYSPTHFQRIFTRTTGLSPAAYARALREERARAALTRDGNVTAAIYEAGYESASRFYDGAKLGMAPSAWANGGRGVTIHWAVVPTTLCDDADIHAWPPGTDVTGRLIRAIVRACKAVPALNAWFDADSLTRTLHPHVDIGIAVDTEDGLFVPALRNADVLDAAGLRAAVNRLRTQVEDRSIPPDELKGYTISLSNFGVFAGRYATPVFVPPCVAIVAAGKGRFQMTPVMGGFESHRVIPLSLTFDHRAATGGEAARFLKAMLDDLSLAQ